MIRNNPYVIGRIENPTEEMQLLAVQLNGQALQYITNPSPAVQEAAIANTARAIQFIDNPSEDIKLQAVRAGWNNLSYLENPSQELIDAALDQSGWAIKYIKDAGHDLQLRAVNKNYDAVKYIKDPAEDVQLAAVRGNYEALRYIEIRRTKQRTWPSSKMPKPCGSSAIWGKKIFSTTWASTSWSVNTSPKISASRRMTGAIPSRLSSPKKTYPKNTSATSLPAAPSTYRLSTRYSSSMTMAAQRPDALL